MLDDLYQADTDAAINDLVRRPPAAKPQAAKFNAWSMLTAAPRGIGAGSNETAGGVADVLGAFGQVMGATDARPSMFSAQTQEQRKQEEQARRKMLDKGLEFDAGDQFRSVAREWMPDATTAHTAERTVFDLFRFGTKAVTSTALAGPVVGPGLVGLDEALTTADDLKRQGVDAETRMKVGAVSGLTAAAGVALPVAGRNPVQTAALVAVGGPGSFIAQQAATRQILQDADYTKLADQIDPLDPVGLAVSTLVPAGFGVWAMRGARGRAAEVRPGDVAPEVRPDAAPVQDAVQTEPARPRPTPDQVDAARVEMLTQHVEGARLTPPEDAAGARAHDEAMTRAMDQLARGERVEVSDVAPVPRVAPTETPEFKAWFGDSKVVDDGGQPLVVYHGTSSDFSQFNAETGWFTASSSEAETYASGSRDATNVNAGQNIVPAYVSIKNPRVLDGDTIGNWRSAVNDALSDGSIDGVIVTSGGRPSWVVPVDPQQIKSAIGNSGKFDPSSPSLTDSRFASWADQINAAIADIRAAAKEAANVQDAPQARADAPATGARQPEPDAQPQAADARGAAPAGAAEQGGGVPRAGGGSPEAAVVAARLADVSQQFPDLTVQMDGMDAPMRLSDFLEQVQREAMEGADFDLGGNDAPLMQVAASCFLLNGA